MDNYRERIIRCNQISDTYYQKTIIGIISNLGEHNLYIFKTSLNYPFVLPYPYNP